MIYTVVINFDSFAKITEDEIEMINKLITTNQIIKIPEKLLILHNIPLNDEDIYGLCILCREDFKVLITENFNIHDYISTSDQNNINKFCNSLYASLPENQLIGHFHYDEDVVECITQSHYYPHTFIQCFPKIKSFYKIVGGYIYFPLYFCEYKKGSIKKILPIVNYVCHIFFGATDNSPNGFYDAIKIKKMNIKSKYEYLNPFDFNCNNYVTIFDETQLSNDINNYYKKIEINDIMRVADYFILNLYILYYEFGLPLEMIIIILGYV